MLRLRRPASPTPPTRWHDFGVPYEEGHAFFGEGRCLVALERKHEAISPLTKARDIFQRIGAYQPSMSSSRCCRGRTYSSLTVV